MTHVFYHELFHVLRGHLNYLSDNKALNFILEFEESDLQNVDKLLFEVDADKYASVASMFRWSKVLVDT